MVRRIVILFCFAVVLNWVWEMLQMPFYAEMANRTFKDSWYRCFKASIGDGFLILISYSISVFFLSQRLFQRGHRYYLGLSIIGFITAVIVELAALKMGRWSYSAQMPVIPILNVGIIPIVQLTVLVPVCVFITHWHMDRSGRTTS